MPKRRIRRYSPKLVPTIRAYAEQGLIDAQIAENLGIHRATLYKWAKEHPEVREALDAGKEIVDKQVENALLKRALGYEYEEVTYEGICRQGETPTDLVAVKRVVKQMAPDVTAQIFWLKNRRPDLWRDRQEIGVSGDMVIEVKLPDDLSADQG